MIDTKMRGDFSYWHHFLVILAYFGTTLLYVKYSCVIYVVVNLLSQVFSILIAFFSTSFSIHCDWDKKKLTTTYTCHIYIYIL